MKKSLAYNFLLQMWEDKKVDEAFLEKQFANGYITEEEMNLILATE